MTARNGSVLASGRFQFGDSGLTDLSHFDFHFSTRIDAFFSSFHSCCRQGAIFAIAQMISGTWPLL